MRTSDKKHFNSEILNVININETIRRTSQKRFRNKLHANALNSVECLIGVAFVHKLQSIKMQHDTLRLILNLIQPMDFNKAVIIGDDLNKFKKGLKRIDRKFNYLEKRNNTFVLHTYCPNCTNPTDSWLKPEHGWTLSNGNYEKISSGRDTPKCCDPLAGKTLHVVHGDVIPMVFM